jgi:hypothetical protein
MPVQALADVLAAMPWIDGRWLADEVARRYRARHPDA